MLGLNKYNEGQYFTKYKNWLCGQKDRLEKIGARYNNGDYLDGYYSPEEYFPGFLTLDESCYMRKKYKVLNNAHQINQTWKRPS